MRTRVTQLLGVNYPILAFSHVREVVVEVTRAGGFGVLGVLGHTADELDRDLAWIDERVGGRGYGVDILLPVSYEGAERGGLTDQEIEQRISPAMVEFVDEIMRRYDVGPLPPEHQTASANSGRFEVSMAGYSPLLDVAFAHPIRLVASALGPPPDYLIERAHAAGVSVAALAGTVRHAERHRAAGVDLIVAQGAEAGGHTGEIGTMVLVPDVVDAVAPDPVLAAGGIADGRQVAAALALGAEGVWCGSVWLITDESESTDVLKRKFLAATASDTVRSASLTGKPARMLRSAWTDEWERPGAPAPLPMPLQATLVAEARKRIESNSAVPGSGAERLANYPIGQVVGRMNTILPTREVVRAMVDGYRQAVDALPRASGLEV